MTNTVTSSIETPRSSLDNYAHANSTASNIYPEHKDFRKHTNTYSGIRQLVNQ